MFQQILFLIFSEQHTNPSPRTGRQGLLVTHFDCEENINRIQVYSNLFRKESTLLASLKRK